MFQIKKTNTRAPIFFYLALGVFALLLISVQLTSSIYARYASGAPDADTARVARFSVDSTLTGFDTEFSFSLKPGETETVSFLIKNNSEVEIQYEAHLQRLSENLPIEISVISADGDPYIGIGATEQVTVAVSWKTGEEYQSPVYAGRTDLFRMSFTVEQKD